MRSIAPAVCQLLLLPIFAIACGSESGTPTPTSTRDTNETTLDGAEVPTPPADVAPSSVPSVVTTATNGAAPAPPEAPAGPTATAPVPYRGINLSGAEFGSALPGKFGVDYTFPTTSEVDYYLAKGMNTFRIGFMWERVQRSAYGEFDATYFGKLDAIVSYATGKGAYVVLNPHNFARYYGTPVGTSTVPNAAFADLWRRLAAKYGSNPRVLMNLVNEPHTMPTEQWVSAANAAIAAIRSTKANNVVIAPGNAWTGAHSWTSNSYGTPNAVAMLAIEDPLDRTLFEVHQYLDQNSGGESDTCVSSKIGSQRMAGFVGWLRAHGKKGFVGEFAGGRNPTCNAAVADMLSYMMAQSDVLVGWLWWAGGPWWDDYPFSLEPTNGQDQPQMGLLAPYLGKPGSK